MITVNGRQQEIDSGETIDGLLASLGFEGRYALVELNGEAVERARYGATRLADGDVVVLARPVAGG